jgi:hypothetical protein
MKICVIFYGFLGDSSNLNNLNRIYDLCDKNKHEINFYYSIPDSISEFDGNKINDELINGLTKDVENFNFEIRDYNTCMYIDECKKLDLPIKTNIHNLYPYRNLSMLDSIKKSVELITKNYDFMIITRLDNLPFITPNKIISDFNVKDKAYLFRNEPKIFGVVEDRFIFGDFNILKNISNVYEYVKKLKFDDENFYSEKLIGEYFVENFKENLEFIDGVNIKNNINYKKYLYETQLIVESLYDTCN